MNRILFFLLISPGFLSLSAQTKITLQPDQVSTTINKHIYGHFAEHLGRCIYDGIYVGDNQSKIPHTNGVRNDIINALRDLQIPNFRWPGGCFADIYHWKDAIGPKEKRIPIENRSWGNVREDNSFGTHEFLDLCELLGAEPYLAVNMNSGSVQEAVEWVQYCNSANNTSHLTDLRAQNGRSKPWHVTYWGIGNESWDCGGHMEPGHYINLYKQYATAMTSYGNTEKLYRIAVGPGSPELLHWTEEIMKNIPARRFEGISIHHYSVFDWSAKGPSADFSTEQYFKTLQRAWYMDEFIRKNKEMMDKYDPEKRVALIVDEWGGWYETDPSGAGQLYQQNTIRDAMIAAMTLNIFNNHADRVRMANLAQTVNVLQAVILTKAEKMVLTPTYHVMEMYKVHQDAMLIPLEFSSLNYTMNNQSIPAVTCSASLDKSRKIHISLCNIDHANAQEIEINMGNYAAKSVTGRILTADSIQAANTFDTPQAVIPQSFNAASLKNNVLSVSLPKHSVVVLELSK